MVPLEEQALVLHVPILAECVLQAPAPAQAATEAFINIAGPGLTVPLNSSARDAVLAAVSEALANVSGIVDVQLSAAQVSTRVNASGSPLNDQCVFLIRNRHVCRASLLWRRARQPLSFLRFHRGAWHLVLPRVLLLIAQQHSRLHQPP